MKTEVLCDGITLAIVPHLGKLPSRAALSAKKRSLSLSLSLSHEIGLSSLPAGIAGLPGERHEPEPACRSSDDVTDNSILIETGSFAS